MKTLQTKKLAELSNDQVSDFHTLIHPFNSFLLPSIMYLWYNQKDGSRSFAADTYGLALLHPYSEKPFWTLSSRTEINQEHLLEAKYIINAVHPTNELRFSTVNDVADSWTIATYKDNIDHFDYIYNVDDLANCLGKKYEDTRRHVRRFFDLYGKDLKIQTCRSWGELQPYKKAAYELFDDWTNLATEGSKDYRDEERAFHLFFNADSTHLFGDIVAILFFYQDKLIGYSINEIYDKQYALNHFHKSNLNLSSIGHYTFYSVAQILRQNGVDFLNFQEDCGIGGLRAFKHKMRPSLVFETQRVTYLPLS